MPLALLQTELEPLDVKRLSAAFLAVPSITTSDAIRIAQNNAYGILMTNLSPKDAALAHLALADQGIRTEAVDLATFMLPPAFILKRLELSHDALVIFDACNQPRPISWASIVVIAAGPVKTTEVESSLERDFLGPHPSWRFSSDDWIPRERHYREKIRDHLILEVLTQDPLARYRIDAKTFQFNCLDARATPDRNRNLILLLGEICGKTNNACMNRGAQSLLDADLPIFTCPGQLQFEQEMTWLWWKQGQRG